MANLQFNEEQAGITRRTQPAKPKGIEGRLIAWGLAKNASQAKLIMIGIIIVAFAIIIFQNIDVSGGNDEDVVDPVLIP